MAKNTIKGLTVEIGGDITKLGKALEDVNKKSSELSSELGQINKLLKLDPGNADLLAQKQKVLADAVSNTAKKLETLKEAEKQVQKQFERGEVSEEQVRALQREIIATEKKMDSYKKAIKETSGSLDKMDDSTKKVEKSSDGLGSKLGSLAKGGVKLLAAGVTAATAALVASAEASREYRTEMGKLDTAFTTAGHSSEAATKTYKALQGVLGETDQAVEAANHLAKLTDNEKDLQTWTDICTGVYATFGASLPIEGLTEAANETAKVGQVTGPLADALNWAGVSEDAFNESLAACTSEQERQRLIMETLNGLYDDAAEKYRETNAEVIRANEANEAWASSMAEVGGSVEPLLTDIKLLGASLLSDLVPGIKEATGAFRSMLSGDEGAAADLGEALSGIFTQLLTKITDLLPQAAEVGVSLITTLGTSIIHALPQLVDTAAQVVLALINGLASAIPQVLAAWQTVLPHLVQSLTNAIPLIIQAGVDLLLALAQAVPLIIEPLTASIVPIVLAVVNGLLSAIPQLIQGAVTFLKAIIQAIPMICEMLAPQIAPIIATICDGLIENIPVLLDGALQLLDALIQAIPLICEALLPEVPRIVQTVTTKLVEMTPVLLDAALTLLFALIEAIPVICLELIKATPSILSAITGVLKALPGLIWGILTQVLGKVGQWVGNMASKAAEAGTKFIGQIVQWFGQLPGKIWTWLQNAISKVVQFGRNAAAKAKTAAGDIVRAVINGVKELPSKMATIGKDLVKGLWNGIKDMVGWVTGKIESFGDSVLSGIKNFFGIKSPSRVFKNEVGKMLAVGLAEGIEANANQPLEAMANLSSDLLGETDAMNGLTLERRLQHTFAAPESVSAAESGMLGKLDKILAAIERGQIITINGDALVGATANTMDNVLGQRRVLAGRGAV